MLQENIKALEELSRQFSLSPIQREQLHRYIDVLESWARRTNLISKSDHSRIASRHIAESLEVTRHSILSSPSSLLDLGSGSGFPGIPLAVYYSNMDVTLVDSKRMKTLFLRDVVESLQLKNVRVLCVRAEELSSEKQFDFVLARAVARLNVLWSWSHQLLKPGAVLVALKGGDLDDEVLELDQNFNVSIRIVPFTKSTIKNGDKKIVIVSSK